MLNIPMHSTLKALLVYSKLNDPDFSWPFVRKALADLYHPEMSFLDVMAVLLRSYEGLLAEPRFESPNRYQAAKTIILAPLMGSHAIGWPGPTRLDTKVSVEEFYAPMISQIMSDFRLSRIDWCRSELYGPEPSLQKSETAETAV